MTTPLVTSAFDLPSNKRAAFKAMTLSGSAAPNEIAQKKKRN